MKREIASDKNWKEAFWETALCSFNSSHRLTAFPSRSHLLSLFLWNLQSDNWKPIEGYGEIEISSIKNWKVGLWVTAFYSVNSSNRITIFPSRSLTLRRFLWNWQRAIWKPLGGYGEKGNIFRSKLEGIFLRNCSVYREFISQSYIFPFKKPFAKAVLVELAKGYLEAHRGLWWKRKYLQFKSGKKLSEKLRCVLLIHLTDLQLFPQEAFR